MISISPRVDGIFLNLISSGEKVSMNFDEICPKVGKVMHKRDGNGR